MNNKSSDIKIRWTSKEIVSGKTLSTIILTIISSVVLIKVANALITLVGNIGNTNRFTRNYSFGIFSVIFIIPAIVLSIEILKVITNREAVDIKTVYQQEAIAVHKRETKFKWRWVYSLVIGYIIMIIFFKANTLIFLNEQVGSLKFIMRTLLGFIVCLASPIILSNIINYIMIKVTQTNKELIEEIRLGKHNEQIPQVYMNDRDLSGIIKILKKAEALRINSAVSVYSAKEEISNMCKASAIVGLVLGVIIVVFTMGATSSLESEIVDNIKGFNGNPDVNKNKNNNKNDAFFKANEASKKAYYDQYQANKAAQYNSNSYDAYAKQNYANNSRQEAERLNREKYK